MSRMSGGDQILVKPSNNVYTVLVAVGIIAEITAMIALWVVHQNLFGFGLFSAGPG